MCLGLIGVVTRRYDTDDVPMAEVDTGDGGREACLLYCPDAAVGDDVLLHMGFVMEVLEPERAAASRELRRQLVEGDGQDVADQA
jgi:hydrogenase maturation factor